MKTWELTSTDLMFVLNRNDVDTVAINIGLLFDEHDVNRVAAVSACCNTADEQTDVVLREVETILREKGIIGNKEKVEAETASANINRPAPLESIELM